MKSLVENDSRRLPWRERRLREWIAALPTAEPVEALTRLAHSLRGLNTGVMDPAARVALLGHYEKPLEDLAYAARSPGMGGAATLVATLHAEMAHGYQMALAPGLRADLRQRAALGALHHLAEVACCAYRAYLPVPPGLWRHIHALFDAAGDRPGMTLRQAYRDILLIGLSNPYALPPGAIDLVVGIVRHYGRFAILEAPGGFRIDPTADRPATTASVPSSRYLETRALVVELVRARGTVRTRRLLPAGLAGLTLPEFGDHLLTHLIGAWVPVGRPRAPRIRLSGQRLLCQGFMALHRLAATADAGKHTCYVDLDQPWASEPPLVDGGTVRPAVWQIRDAGKMGLWLAAQGADVRPPRPGTLVGIQDPLTSDWSAAIVRWLKRARPREYAIGVEILGVATSVTVLGRDSALPALRIESEHGVSVSLLVAAGRLEPGRSVRIRVGDEERVDLPLRRLAPVSDLERFALPGGVSRPGEIFENAPHELIDARIAS